MFFLSTQLLKIGEGIQKTAMNRVCNLQQTQLIQIKKSVRALNTFSVVLSFLTDGES